MKNPLLDKDFLLQLDSQQSREVFAKIIALDYNEDPVEEVTGRITQGSVSINGSSAVRRTCSLSMVASELNIHEYYWGLNTKFELKVGLKNTINESYPEIIWFPQGIYLISSFSTSQSTNSYTISLQGKDKMCMLNGDVGGVITALSVDFGKYDTIAADGTITTESYLIKEIIKEAVHEYAKEPFQNIIINDLDDVGIELLEYRGKDPMYLLVNLDSDVINQPFFDDNITGFYDYYTGKPISIKDKNFKFDQRIEIDVGNGVTPTYIKTAHSDTKYSIIKVEYGDVVGYRTTDLTYAGDLICEAGSSITSMLDKIVSMLGSYEYFYNLEGQFVFQKKKTYVQTSWNNIVNNTSSDTYVDNAAYTSSFTYYFENANIVTSFSNTPDLMNLKNDYSVWGTRTSVSGAELPVHLRYAIDKKPCYYKTYEGQVFFTDKYRDYVKEKLDSLQRDKDYVDKSIVTSVGEAYTLKYTNPTGLTTPTWDGEQWTPGWWDIRDWHDYYYLITGQEPAYTMKFYSKGDITGCVPTTTLKPLADSMGIDFHVSESSYVWLIIVDAHTIDTYHGMGDPTNGYERLCTCYESKEVNGSIVTTQTNPIITKEFPYPFAGCTDRHTYLEFLKNENTETRHVYFYNPDLFFGNQNYEVTFEDQEALDAAKKEDSNLDNNPNYHEVDWRELIYQMAEDYKRHMHDDDFYVMISKNNQEYYPSGYTGYEQYYTDMDGFWRQLYDPFYTGSYKIAYVNKTTFDKTQTDYYYYIQCSNKVNYDSNRTYYTQSLAGAYTAVSKLSKETYDKNPQDYYYLYHCSTQDQYDSKKQYYEKYDDEFDKNTYWSNTIKESPETLNFWFDFLDSEGELEQYSVKNVGARPKAENNSDVKAIYFRETPNVIYVEEGSITYTPINITEDMFNEDDVYYYTKNASGSYDLALSYNPNVQYYYSSLDEQKTLKPGYSFLQLPGTYESYFKISSQGKSAKDELDNLLYNYAYCTESINLTTLPIYYLQPNTRIFVRDDNSGISGEYIIDSLTVPLTYNGTMNITAKKAVENMF